MHKLCQREECKAMSQTKHTSPVSLLERCDLGSLESLYFSLPACLPSSLSVYQPLSAGLPACLSAYLSVYLPVCFMSQEPVCCPSCLSVLCPESLSAVHPACLFSVLPACFLSCLPACLLCLLFCLSVSLPAVGLSVCCSACLSVYLPACRLSACVLACLLFCLPSGLPAVCLSACLPVCLLPVCPPASVSDLTSNHGVCSRFSAFCIPNKNALSIGSQGIGVGAAGTSVTSLLHQTCC